MKEPKPPAEIPEPPDHLSETAVKEWRRMAELLARLHLLTFLDRAAFSAYCTVYARWVQAEEALKQQDRFLRLLWVIPC
jgi:P27 family predicted phage terminase small subunit